MIFGQVANPSEVNFELPLDHPDTIQSLKMGDGSFEAYVGCAKWNKTDLKNFYPKGVKDELTYYSSQFNSIELNATFYGAPTKAQVELWKSKTPEGFKFFPKITNTISHFKRLIDTKESVESYCEAISAFEEKLGMVFLQMHDKFHPKDMKRVERFLDEFPAAIPLAVEVRNETWYCEKKEADFLFEILKRKGLTQIIVDTAGRRDMLHMRLTNPVAFIRFVGANHPSDYKRLNDWIERIAIWKKQGLEKLYFFVHQNVELESPLLSAHFIENLNKKLNVNLQIPQTLIKA